jgi:murein DD-endopeptidase MepM/ murein hydrolase activator NlpD
MLRPRRGPVDEPLPISLVLSVPDFEDPPSFQWPVAGPVTSTFGRRSRSWHRGVDIQAVPGTPIFASAAGVVIASGFEARYGQRVKIEHEGGFVTVYAHNERNLVEVGEEVAVGQVIGVVGRTGRATAEHVHFEIRYEGRVYNPLYLLPLPPRSVQVELAVTEPHDEDDE